MNLRSWLRRQPQPTSLRVRTDNGWRSVAVPPEGPRRWAELLETIEKLAPSIVEAIGAKDEVLRSTDLDVEAAHGARETDETVQRDPEADRIVLIARELRQMAQHDRQAATDERRYTFETVAGIASSFSEAVMALTNQVATLTLALAQAKADAVAKDEDESVMNILGNMVQSAPKSASKPNGHKGANGAAKPNGSAS